LENYNPITIIFDIYMHINGDRFKPSIQIAKFSKLTHIFKIVGTHLINKAEIERSYNLVSGQESQMDFYGFVSCLEDLVDKAWGIKEGGKIRKLENLDQRQRDENEAEQHLNRV
jgi:hypothetical protein